MKNTWINENLNLGLKDKSSLEFIKNDLYHAQAELTQLVNVFEGQSLFGDFNLIITVFDNNKKVVETKKIIGLNANIKQARNSMKHLKKEIEDKYFN